MSKKDNFFIGWKEEMPASNRQSLRKILIPIFVGIPVLVVLFVFFQQPFNNHFFEFGNVKEITGTYYDQPFPILKADKGVLADSLSQHILLVGYGKFGAKGTMNGIQEKSGNLVGKKITLAGTLIYGDGKTLMELTREKESLIQVSTADISPQEVPPAQSPISVKGEILDPKCYFGVMKPGEGKIHKSCAIRCISGGIPPVFRHGTGGAKNDYQYFLMVDENGKSINKEILPFVAEPILIDGNTKKYLGWDILYLNVNEIKMQN